MFKLALKQFRTEKPGFIGTFFTIATIALIAIINIGSQFILETELSKGSSIAGDTQRQAFMQIMIFFIQVMVITVLISLNYSIKRRWNNFVSLRMQGATSWQLRKIIIFETMILSFLATLLMAPVGAMLIKPYYDAYADTGFLPQASGLGSSQIFTAILGASITIVALSGIIAFFSSRKLKHITMTEINDKYSLGGKKELWIRLGFGLPSVFSPILMFMILPKFGIISLQGSFGQALMAMPLFLTILGLGLLSKYILSFVFKTFKFFSKGTSKYFYSGLWGSINKVGGVTAGIATILTFQMVIATTFTVVNEASGVATNQYYENLNAYNVTGLNETEINGYKVDDSVTIAHNSLVQIGYLTGAAGTEITSYITLDALLLDGKFKYNIMDGESNDYSLQGQEVSPGKIWISEEVILLVNEGQGGFGHVSKVGDKLKLRNEQGVLKEFEIERYVDNLYAGAGFPAFYLNVSEMNFFNPKSISIVSDNEITALSDRKLDFLASYEKQGEKSKLIILIVTVVVISLAGIGILNAFFLYVFDRKKEYELQLVIGKTSKELLRQTVKEAAFMTVIGILFAFYATFTYTVPFSLRNVNRAILFSAPATILTTFAIVTVVILVFVYLVTKLIIINKIKTANINND